MSAYLIGKRSLCQLPGQGDVYRRCEAVKAISTSLMRERAEQGALVPSKDPVIAAQIRKLDPDHPVLCPSYIRSRVFLSGDGSGIRIAPSTALKAKAERVSRERTWPSELAEIASGVCPYEVLLSAAQRSGVLVVNYHHISDEEIRNQLYGSLQIEPSDAVLLIDEAHNCGDVMQKVMNVTLRQPFLAQAERELAGLKKHVKAAAAVTPVIRNIAPSCRGCRGHTRPRTGLTRPSSRGRSTRFLVIRGPKKPDRSPPPPDRLRRRSEGPGALLPVSVEASTL